MAKHFVVEQASKYVLDEYNIKWPVHTMNKWRSQGRGPSFIHLNGRVYYRQKDLDYYIQHAKYIRTVLGPEAMSSDQKEIVRNQE